MTFKYLSFDLETIPQDEKTYTSAQLKQLKKKQERFPTWEDNTIKGTDPFLGKIIAIGIYYKNDFYEKQTQNMAIYGDDEKHILEEFWDGISSLSEGTKLLSFNGFNFDIPWIRIRSLVNEITIPKLKVNFFNLNPFKGTPHIDLMVELKGDKYNQNINVSLEMACDACGIPSPKDAIDGSQVYKAYLDGRIEEIAAYAKKDVVANGMLYEKLKKLNYI